MEGVIANINSICMDFDFECNRLAILAQQTEERRLRILRRRRKRRQWIHPINAQRLTLGVFSTFYLELRDNPDKFFNYVWIRQDLFEILVERVGAQIQRRDTYLRFSISPAERLMVTLQFLATGESFAFLHYQFRLGILTISGIVQQTCRALWDCLKKEYIPQPTQERWLEIADNFQQICQFLNCFGAVDGKHIRIAKPIGSGSEFFNYKKFFSIVLMAIADSKCKFIAVDIGVYGRSNDSQVFKMSAMGRRLYGDCCEFIFPFTIEV
ncbi:uncharacterized protein [Dendrobates tinctorius]|uniref:uncharacterized protein n=1 Tax=Dendrobates tinctorius TaxID=92724 RepID=UPI003CCA1432